MIFLSNCGIFQSEEWTSRQASKRPVRDLLKLPILKTQFCITKAPKMHVQQQQQP